jgi:hypothetical protein
MHKLTTGLVYTAKQERQKFTIRDKKKGKAELPYGMKICGMLGWKIILQIQEKLCKKSQRISCTATIRPAERQLGISNR